MPGTKSENIVFTAITAWIMVYIMTLYNSVMAMGCFTNSSFLIAPKGMWVEYIIMCIFHFFPYSKVLCVPHCKTG